MSWLLFVVFAFIGPGEASLREPAGDMRARALNELTPKSDSYMKVPAANSAVVRTSNIIAEDPVRYVGLKIGLTAQNHGISGMAPLTVIGSADLANSRSTWMGGLEAQYLPWTTGLWRNHTAGFRLGAAYARQSLPLTGPSGVAIQNTMVHSLISYFLLSQQWSLYGSRWSFHADVGGARADVLLTSSSTVGEASTSSWWTVARVGPSFHLGSMSVNLSYEMRRPVSEGWARLPDSAFVLGLLYGVR